MSKFGRFFGFRAKNSFKQFKAIFLWEADCSGNFYLYFSCRMELISA